METILIVLVGAIVAILLLGVAILFYDEDRKQRDLTERSALRIARPLSPTGARSGVQQRIQPRASSVSSFTVKPLPSVEAARFSDEWRRVQQRFTDDPQAAIADADRLAQDIMDARGYPMPDVDPQPTRFPAGHAVLIENYRRAHLISQANDRGKAATTELRQALVHYRSLFAELLDAEEAVLTRS